MSEENRDQEAGEAGAESPPAVGSQLKAAREARQMGVGDVALALKLGARQVEALENGDWQSLPGQTFIRGFVRNYARLLQIDPAPLMAQLDAVLDSPQLRLTLPGQPQRQVTMPEIGRPRRRDYAMVWVGALLVALAAGIYFLLPDDLSQVRRAWDSLVAVFDRQDPAPAAPPAQPSSPEPVFPPGSTPQQVMNPQSAAPEAGASASSPLVPPPVIQEPQAKPAEPPAAASPPSPAASVPAPGADRAATLRFTFVQDSWVEVRDRHGKVLFSQLNRAGSEQSIDGQGPFSLVIGNAPGVRLSLRGRPVELAPRTQGNVARLTLE